MRIAPVVDFAARFHRDPWYVRRLPADLGARFSIHDAGPDLLGVAAQGRRRAIGLNAAIIGTPLELPVIAHECGHLLLGHDIGFCSTTFSPHALEERDAWASAALLAISQEAGIALAGREATVWEIAQVFAVPRALVYMRGALAVVLGEAPGDRERARQQLAASRRSLESWMAWTAKGI